MIRDISVLGMRGTSIVFHNNSHVMFRRHYHGHLRRVRYYDNLDKLFDESKERSHKHEDEVNQDELPHYLRKKTTSFGKRWQLMKAKRKYFFRPPKKKTTKYMFWAVVKSTTKKFTKYAWHENEKDKKKELAKKYKVW